ncbi:hypothetical protein ABVT39_022575 [Epinephelus coioides]
MAEGRAAATRCQEPRVRRKRSTEQYQRQGLKDFIQRSLFPVLRKIGRPAGVSVIPDGRRVCC